jgi:RNA polymerase sigma-70 factor (ECF subfamily)
MPSFGRIPSFRLVPPSSGDGQRSDLEVVEGLRAGEEWASEAIWDRYSDQVGRFFARALGRSTDDVEDLIQEVFLRILTRPSTIRDPAALREFIMGVAMRVLKNRFRYRWIRRIVHLSEDGQLPDLPAQDGADEGTRHALQRCYAIFDHLSARERAAFVLRYLEEMTLDEVASCLAISRTSVKRLVKSATGKVSADVAKDADLQSFFLELGGRSSRDRR